jgi:hypothetical protein
MEAKDLRISNWVIGENSFPTKITAYDYEHSDFDKIQPIPLSPELLIAAGFKKDGKLPHWIYYRYRTGNHGERKTFTIASNSDATVFYFEAAKGRRMTASFHYLHQLQNLYYSLTQEELTIDLK